MYRMLRYHHVLASLILLANVASAQTVGVRLDRPDVQAIDENYVSVSGAKPSITVEGVAIGSEKNKLAFSVTYVPEQYGHSIYHNFNAGVRRQQYPSRSNEISFEVHTGDSTELFHYAGGVYSSYSGTGSSLTETSAGYVYVNGVGAEFTFDKSIQASGRGGLASLTLAKYPDGYQVSYYYVNNQIRSVNDNRGMQLKFIYGGASPYLLGGLLKVIAINNAYEYCAPVAETCSLTQSWPEAAISSGTLPQMPEHEGNLTTVTITDSVGLSTRLTSDGFSQLVRVKEKSSVSDNIVYTYCRYTSPYNCWTASADGGSIVSGVLVAAVNAGRTWTYDFWSAPNTGNYFATGKSIGPFGTMTALTRILGRDGPLLSITNSLGENSGYEESDRNLPLGFADGRGRRYKYDYDARANLIQKTQFAADGSGLSNIAQMASYDVNCLNIRTCNKPNWVQDARSARYEYTYDPTHAGVLTVTSPAATTGGPRPQTRNVYVQRYAWTKTASGSYAKSDAALWLLASTSSCRTGAPSATGGGCALGAADEVVTTYDYGLDAGPNNLWPRGEAITATDDGVTRTLRTCYTYDRFGNMISRATPRANLASCS